jgi:hypothetical protein
MTKIAGPSAWPLAREPWIEFAPMVGRIVRLEPTTPVRLIQPGNGRRTALAKLPSGALVDRTIATRDSDSPVGPGLSTADESVDVTARAGELATWLGSLLPDGGLLPERADASWRGGRPPTGHWERVEAVPGEVVRDLVRQGAEAHVAAADQGLGARAADALLDFVVLTVTSGSGTATVTNRSLSALSSMGFLPVGGNVVVSVNRGWTRVAGEFGSAYAEPVRRGLVLL